jgi:hypothetical protein
MRLSDTQRLLVAIVATVITVGLFWPSYRNALRHLNESLLTNISSDDAQAADSEPSGEHWWRECTGSALRSDRECGPWHYGIPPWRDR